MNLSTKPGMVVWPETHYVFVEKVGPFQKNAPAAWKEMGQLIPELLKQNTMTDRMSLYKPEAGIYRAGVCLKSKPNVVPAGCKYQLFKGGNYAKFVLKGSYADLPEACGRVFDMVDDQDIKMRDDFCIEHYVTAYGSVPDDKHITEILIPTQP